MIFNRSQKRVIQMAQQRPDMKYNDQNRLFDIENVGNDL